MLEDEKFRRPLFETCNIKSWKKKNDLLDPGATTSQVESGGKTGVSSTSLVAQIARTSGDRDDDRRTYSKRDVQRSSFLFSVTSRGK